MRFPRLTRIALTACVVALMSSTADAAGLVAERITPETAPAHVMTGSDACGGVGDWYLANDVIEVVIDDPGARTGVVGFGGTIIDAGFRGRSNEDQFVQLFPILNIDQRVLAQYDSIRAEVNEAEGYARITVWSSQGITSMPRGSAMERLTDLLVPDPDKLRQITIETSYTVRPGEPFVHLSTTIRNLGSRPAPIFAYADATLRGSHAMRAWIGHTLDPARAVGFQQRELDLSSTQGIQNSITAMTHLVVPGVRQFEPISYGLFAPDRTAAGNVQFGVSDYQVSAMAVFIGHDWPELTITRLLRGLRSTLSGKSEWTYDRIFAIGEHADVASLTDVMWQSLVNADGNPYADGTSGITGRVSPDDVDHAILVNDAYTGKPVTQVSSLTSGPEAGTFRVNLPPGKYALHIRAPHVPKQVREIVVPLNTFADTGVIRLPQPGWLVFDKPFADGGPGRVVVEGIDGTPDPVFEPELFDFTVDGERIPGGAETRELYFVGGDADPHRVPVPPGKYRLTATRGFEHGVDQEVVTVAGPGAETRVRALKPPRVLSVPDYVTADFHVHGEASEDSILSNELRVRMFVSDRVDVLTSTDHDNVGNLQPAVDALGVGDRLKILTGAEVTGTSHSPGALWTIGHSNVWPLHYDPYAHAHNSPPSEGHKLGEIYEIMRRDFDVDVIQLNHPRSDSGSDRRNEGNYFTHLGSVGEPLDPDMPLTKAPNNVLLEPSPGGTRAIDFDAIELLNGEAYHSWLLVRRDWYALLRQGYRRTGTANSDSHTPRSQAAYPRNYVYYPPGLEKWDEHAFDDQVKAGRVFGTTGPLFRTFKVNSGMMGDTVAAPEGAVTVELEVAAAPWVPVDEVRVLVDGEVHTRLANLSPLEGAPIVRLKTTLTLDVPRDAIVTAEAGVPLLEPDAPPPPKPGGIYNRLAPDFRPLAFTNPVYVDVDGNGRYDPPAPTPHVSPTTREIPLYVFAVVALIMLFALWIARRKQD